MDFFYAFKYGVFFKWTNSWNNVLHKKTNHYSLRSLLTHIVRKWFIYCVPWTLVTSRSIQKLKYRYNPIVSIIKQTVRVFKKVHNYNTCLVIWRIYSIQTSARRSSPLYMIFNYLDDFTWNLRFTRLILW